VRDTHFNNVPSLSRSASTPDVHRFETPALPDGDSGPALVLYRRLPAPVQPVPLSTETGAGAVSPPEG